MRDTNIVVIEGRNVKDIDATVAKNLSLLLADLESRKQRLVFWNWCEDARRTLVAFDASMEPHLRSASSLAQLVSGESLSRNSLDFRCFNNSCSRRTLKCQVKKALFRVGNFLISV